MFHEVQTLETAFRLAKKKEECIILEENDNQGVSRLMLKNMMQDVLKNSEGLDQIANGNRILANKVENPFERRVKILEESLDQSFENDTTLVCEFCNVRGHSIAGCTRVKCFHCNMQGNIVRD